MRVLHTSILPVGELNLLASILSSHKQEVIRNSIDMTELDALWLCVNIAFQAKDSLLRFIIIRVNGRRTIPKALIESETFPKIEAMRNVQLLRMESF